MSTISLPELASENLDKARAARAGRSSVTVFGGREHRLRQTMIAMRGAERLDDHMSPGEATLQGLIGKIVLRSESGSWTVGAGDFVKIPDEVHSVEAVTDAVFLLTVSKRDAHLPL